MGVSHGSTPAVAPPRHHPARVHLRILGQDRAIDVPAPFGPATLRDLLPTARELSHRASQMALAVATEEGDSVSCRAGCAACCRQLVPISVVEAHDLARAVAALPSDRREAIRARFAETVTTMERLGFLDPNAHPGRTRILSPTTDLRQGWSDVVARYFAAQIPCPVLEDERCSLYEDRPIVCREVLVVSRPEECTTLGLARTIARPIQGSEALATAAREFLGEPLPMLPLPLALEWSQAEGGVLELESDGGNLFNHLVAAVDQVEVPE